MIEQAELKRLQRRLLSLEEVGLGLAALLACAGVAVIRIVGGLHIRLAAAEFLGERVFIKPRLLIEDEVLQVIGIPVLLRETQQDDRLADEDAAPRLARRHAVVFTTR